MIGVGKDMRPTLEELAAATVDPWMCPHCGCNDWRTVTTYRCKDGSIRRQKACRHCHYLRRTIETLRDNSK
jgi:hypothetical protein